MVITKLISSQCMTQMRRTIFKSSPIFHSLPLFRTIHSSIQCYMPSESFESAVQSVQQLPNKPDNASLLKLYALFKQATVGPNNTSQPGMLDFVKKAKWQAWKDIGDMTQEEAEQQYISFSKDLGANVDNSNAPASENANTSKTDSTSEHIAITRKGHVCEIKFNRAKKRNAITLDMYETIIATLTELAKEDTIKVVVLTGDGPFYSSGNDLSNFTSNMPEGGPAALAEQAGDVLTRFVDAFIEFPKVIVAAVNGPAVGIPVTTLPLCDVVYASHKSTYHTPFPALGQTPEACSSVTFPEIMGPSRATEMLLFGRKLDAYEAKEWGLVSEVFEDSVFQQEVQKRVENAAKLPPQALKLGKGIIRQTNLEKLKQVNREEVALIKTRWLSDECINAIMQFMSRK